MTNSAIERMSFQSESHREPQRPLTAAGEGGATSGDNLLLPFPDDSGARDAAEALDATNPQVDGSESNALDWEVSVHRRVHDLIARTQSARPESDPELLEKAYAFAKEKHSGQMRLSGEPYIEHPIAVAGILAELGMDDVSIAAGLLHDVQEDCGVTFEEMNERFGADVAQLVEGVTKIKRIDFSSKQDKQAENLRKLFIGMSGDVRVIIVKLADRLHNMRTLDPFSEQKRRDISSETLHIFAPIAHRLGIWRIKWELEDRSFKYLQPDVYKQIYALVQRTRTERSDQIAEAMKILQERLDQEGIKCRVTGRPKHFYSIYQKMVKQGLRFEAVHDLTALRIICDGQKHDCYHALGVVHSLWTPVPEMFFDYIGQPKPNNYQSLHTKVRDNKGQLIEVQIRTPEMHREAEFGIAAHWRYKEDGQPERNLGDKLRWMRVVLETHHETRGDPQGFLDSVKLDLSSDQIFVFTPRGDVIYLPPGSTPVDFAFRVHSEIGNKCVGVKINGRIARLDHKLQNGDIVEIETSRTSTGPKNGWLDFVVTPVAKSRIRAHLRRQGFEENQKSGLKRLERAARAERLRLGSVAANEELEKCAKSLGLKSAAELLAGIGCGDLSAEHVLNRIRGQLVPISTVAKDVEDVSTVAANLLKRPLDMVPESQPDGGLEFRKDSAEIRLDSEHSAAMLFTLGRCCAPIRGDAVRGYVTRGRGVTVHRQDCPNLNYYEEREPDRIVQASWVGVPEKKYSALLAVECGDRTGLLADLASVIASRGINIMATSTYPLKNNRARFNLAVCVDDSDQLQELISSIRSGVAGVHEVQRV